MKYTQTFLQESLSERVDQAIEEAIKGLKAGINDFMRNYGTIETVDLDNNKKISPKDLPIILHELILCGCLENLYMCNIGLDDNHVNRLEGIISGTQSLKSVRLNDNNFSIESTKKLIQSAAQNKSIKYFAIRTEKNKYSTQDFDDIVDILNKSENNITVYLCEYTSANKLSERALVSIKERICFVLDVGLYGEDEY